MPEDRLPPSSPRRRPARLSLPGWTQGVVLLLLLYLFLLGLKMMGSSFKLMGEDFSKWLFTLTSNPFGGLFVGVLATAIVQSSSMTTSITVMAVVSGDLSLAGAIPIIMGANIGTSVTNVLVSLVHVRRRDEFQRAFAGAIVHDLFNWCTVIVFFPLELFTGYLAWISEKVELLLAGARPVEALNVLDLILKPPVKAFEKLLQSLFGMGDIATGAVMAVVSLALLFVVLTGMTKLLKGFVVGRMEKIIDRYLFRYALLSYLLGLFATAVVQSSSVTTSMVVPLMGAGLLTLEQIYPYTLGANVGTTVTALLAALAQMGSEKGPAGLTIAIVHLLFNMHGCVIFYPLRVIPIRAARFYARIAANKPRYAAAFIIVVFFAVPAAGLVVIHFPEVWEWLVGLLGG